MSFADISPMSSSPTVRRTICPITSPVSKLVFDASFAASVPHYETSVPGSSAVTPLYYMDTLAGVNFQPTEYVDISDTIALKIRMLEKHESQLLWMREHDGIDFAEFVRTCARFRGLQCSVAYAEAFTPCLAWPKLTTKRLTVKYVNIRRTLYGFSCIRSKALCLRVLS